MDNNFCFIIPSYCNSDLHGLQLKRCINSIRKHHDNKIFIIDDYSSFNINLYISNFNNIEILKSQIKGAGDMVTYYNFTKIDGFENAVIIQDSMTLECRLDNINDNKTIQNIWHFTNHRLHWHKIKEPNTEYNKKNNIKVHDDLVIDCINNMIKKNDFKNWIKDIYFQKEKWSGNIGCQSIVNKEFLIKLNDKTDIVNILLNMNNNRLRRVAESVFPLACQFVLGESFIESSYDGIYYDGINEQNNKKTLTTKSINLGDNGSVEQVCKNKYFSKITFNRRPINTNN